jgi:hypothetical protein
MILRTGAEHIAAFIAEPVGGSSTGASVPPMEYFQDVRSICDRHEILFIADEVLVGAGRTGTFTAIEQFGVIPDILTLGKGISGGYVPLSAVVTSKRLVEVIAKGSGDFLHAQTFSHHAVLCAAGLAAMRFLEKNQLVERCAEVSGAFHRKLKPLADLPFVGDVRGRGLLAGIEFVLDKVTKAPFPREAKFAEKFTEAAQRAGLIVWSNVGHADGIKGDLIMFAPPFIVTEEQMDDMVTGFRQALESTVKQLDSHHQPARA